MKNTVHRSIVQSGSSSSSRVPPSMNIGTMVCRFRYSSFAIVSVRFAAHIPKETPSTS